MDPCQQKVLAFKLNELDGRSTQDCCFDLEVLIVRDTGLSKFLQSLVFIFWRLLSSS